jgi:hypothetical protein
LKEKVKEAILEGEIANDKDEARNFVIKEAKLLGLEIGLDCLLKIFLILIT